MFIIYMYMACKVTRSCMLSQYDDSSKRTKCVHIGHAYVHVLEFSQISFYVENAPFYQEHVLLCSIWNHRFQKCPWTCTAVQDCKNTPLFVRILTSLDSDRHMDYCQKLIISIAKDMLHSTQPRGIRISFVLHTFQ